MDLDLLIAIVAAVVLVILVEFIGRNIKYPQNEILDTEEFKKRQEKIEAGYSSTLSMQSVKEESKNDKK